MKRLILIVGLFFVVLSVPILSEATPFTINNSGFENPSLSDGASQTYIPGWNRMNKKTGVWNPKIEEFKDGVISEWEEGNNNISYVNNDSSIYQLIDHSLTADTVTTLTLGVDVGWRLGKDEPEYEVQLWLGENMLISEFSKTLLQGEFVTSLSSCNVIANDHIGEKIKIVLLNNEIEGLSQANFDNVWLTNDNGTHSAVPVPEPATIFLVGSGLFAVVGLGRKKLSKKI